MPPLFSPEELENLEKYNGFMNDLSIRVKGGWLPPNTPSYDEDLLCHTLGLSPRIGSNTDFYPDSDKNQGARISKNPASNSEKKTESDQNSNPCNPLKRPLHGPKRENRLQDR